MTGQDIFMNMPGPVPTIQFPRLSPPPPQSATVPSPPPPAPTDELKPFPSIWQERPQSKPLFGAEDPQSARSRAGTLPSRLQTAEVSYDHLGSSALLSPNTDAAESLTRAPRSRLQTGMSASRGTSPAALPIPLSAARRPRAGSLNSAQANTAFSPFAPSIWSTSTAPVPADPFSDPNALRPRSYTPLGQSPDQAPSGLTPCVNPVGAVGGPVPRSRGNTMGAHTTADEHVVSVNELSPVPTIRLWVNNVAPNATTFALHTIFGQYGRIQSANTLPRSHTAYVTFDDLSSAVDAQLATNGEELFAGRGPSMVGFVKVDSRPPTPTGPGTLGVLEALDASPTEVAESSAMLRRSQDFKNYASEAPGQPELSDRVYVSAVLREVRKRIESDNMSRRDIEETALAMMDELGVLASDYMGNTVVQQLFEHCSDEVKDMMLRELRPYLAQTGVHKNGTWAAQKIIDTATTSRQRHMVVEALRPYTVPLFLDQYGNYVIQGCLKFQAPWNDFIFETILAKLPEISQGRFGARAIRACLESPYTTKQQQRLVAAAIVEESAALTTNANGTLLVSWLLDTFHASRRFALVSQKILPHLATLATSKLGSQVLLKLMTNRVDGQPAQQLLDALLDLNTDVPSQTLEQVLADPGNGPVFLYKLLSSGLTENSLERQVAVNKIRMLLLQPEPIIPSHKRLLEEVGLGMLEPAS